MADDRDRDRDPNAYLASQDLAAFGKTMQRFLPEIAAYDLEGLQEEVQDVINGALYLQMTVKEFDSLAGLRDLLQSCETMLTNLRKYTHDE